MTAEALLAWVLTLGLAGAWLRLLLWRRAGEPKGPAWRFAMLIVLQPIWLALLYLTLLPPRIQVEHGSAVILTADWQQALVVPAGPRIALPEAGAARSERAPDLATVLRRYRPSAITVVGQGLTARDRDRRDVALSFEPAPLPNGVIGFVPPPPAAPGSDFAVHGAVRGAAGSVELADPAGRRVDALALPLDGRFVLHGTARVPGASLFKLTLRDNGGAIVERADVPLLSAPPAATRLLLLGTPDAETKYLRRWATDAGLTVEARLAAGGGITIGSPASIGARRKADVVVIDDRGWAALGPGEKAAILTSVRNGAGLVVRATGPLSGSLSRDLRSLGFAVGDGRLEPLDLPKEAPDAVALAARRGPGSVDVPAAINAGQNEAPPLTISHLRFSGADSTPFVGPPWLAALGRWQTLGRGRVGIIGVTDSYALTLTGQKERYGELWGSVIGTLASARGHAHVGSERPPVAGARMTLCHFDRPTITDGEAHEVRLFPDPSANGCAGFWPKHAGWYRIDGDPFYVWPADQLIALRAADTRDQTLALAQIAPERSGVAAAGPRGSSVPWFIAWLCVSGALWRLERTRSTEPTSGA